MLVDGIFETLIYTMPFWIVIVIPNLLGGIFKAVAGAITYRFSRFSGYSIRQSKKFSKKAKSAVDLISTGVDLHKTLSK